MFNQYLGDILNHRLYAHPPGIKSNSSLVEVSVCKDPPAAMGKNLPVGMGDDLPVGMVDDLPIDSGEDLPDDDADDENVCVEGEDLPGCGDGILGALSKWSMYLLSLFR